MVSGYKGKIVWNSRLPNYSIRGVKSKIIGEGRREFSAAETSSLKVW